MNERFKHKKNGRKKSLRIMAVLLSMCILFTTCPDIVEMLSVFAAETYKIQRAVTISGVTGCSEPEYDGNTVGTYYKYCLISTQV